MIDIYMSDKESINRQIGLLRDIAYYVERTDNNLFNECVDAHTDDSIPVFYTNGIAGGIVFNETTLNQAIRELEMLSPELKQRIMDILTPELLARAEAEENIREVIDVSRVQTGRKIRYIDGVPVEAPASSEEPQQEEPPVQTPKKKKPVKINRKTPKRRFKKREPEPSVSEPSGSEPSGSEPSGSEPSGSEPSSSPSSELDSSVLEEEEEEQEPEEEQETHVFIIHGTLDPNDNGIDTDEELEKRQKYIYDLRYWTWKRLNSLGTFRESVEWENVEAFFYRHTEDSVWSRMFSPPIFWTPIDNAGTVFNKIAQAGVFGKYDFGNTELTETNLSIVRRIAQLINKRHNVLLYGFSVGGLVVQRVCELLNICSYNEELSSLILGLDLDVDDLQNFLKAATFGSIYISPNEKVDNVSLINYMLVDDVATRTNFFDFGFGYLVPNFEDYDPEYIHYICNQYTTILYEYLKIENTNIVYLHKWHSEWYDVWKKKQEIGAKVFTDYRIEELKNLYREHNAKYDLVFNKLVKSRTNDVEDLPQTCRRPSAAAVENAPAPIEPLPNAIRYVDVATTVEELIEDEIHVPEDFYNQQDDYIRRKSATLNRKLREAEEAREALDAAELRREDQKSQRDARARRREALKELRTDLVDITENGAVDLLTRTNTVEAENPEEDILNVSNILAQLEARSVFLKGDGLKNMRFLTTQAINRGIGRRNQIQRVQGGSKRNKKEQSKEDSETVS
jgi:hypothetical protein